MDNQIKQLLIQIIICWISLIIAFFSFHLFDSVVKGSYKGWTISGGFAAFIISWFLFNKFLKESTSLESNKSLQNQINKKNIGYQRVYTEITDSFAKGINKFLGESNYIEELNIFCLTSGSYYHQLFEDRHTRAGKVKIVLPTEKAIDLFYQGTGGKLVEDPIKSASLVKKDIQLTYSKWIGQTKKKDRQNKPIINSVEFRYIDTVPSFYISSLNEEKLLTGFYVLSNGKDIYNGFDLDYAFIDDSTAKLKVSRPDSKSWFESIWKASSNNFWSSSKVISNFFEQLAHNYEPKYRYSDEIVDNCFNLITKKLANDKISVLDVGSGPASISKKALKFYPKAAISLIDSSPTMLGLAALGWPSNATPPRIIVGNAETKIGLFQNYDLIILSAVLHLFEKPIEYIKNASNKLTPNGILLIITYDKQDLEDFLFYKFFPGFKEQESKRIRASQDLIKELRKAEMNIISASKQNYSFNFKNIQALNNTLIQRQFSALCNMDDAEYESKKETFLKKIKNTYNNSPIECNSKATVIIASKNMKQN